MLRRLPCNIHSPIFRVWSEFGQTLVQELRYYRRVLESIEIQRHVEATNMEYDLLLSSICAPYVCLWLVPSSKLFYSVITSFLVYLSPIPNHLISPFWCCGVSYSWLKSTDLNILCMSYLFCYERLSNLNVFIMITEYSNHSHMWETNCSSYGILPLIMYYFLMFYRLMTIVHKVNITWCLMCTIFLT